MKTALPDHATWTLRCFLRFYISVTEALVAADSRRPLLASNG